MDPAGKAVFHGGISHPLKHLYSIKQAPECINCGGSEFTALKGALPTAQTSDIPTPCRVSLLWSPLSENEEHPALQIKALKKIMARLPGSVHWLHTTAFHFPSPPKLKNMYPADCDASSPVTEIMSLALGKLTALIIYLLEYPSPALQPAHVFPNRECFTFLLKRKCQAVLSSCLLSQDQPWTGVGRKCKMSGPFLQTHRILMSDADINKNWDFFPLFHLRHPVTTSLSLLSSVYSPSVPPLCQVSHTGLLLWRWFQKQAV